MFRVDVVVPRRLLKATGEESLKATIELVLDSSFDDLFFEEYIIRPTEKVFVYLCSPANDRQVAANDEQLEKPLRAKLVAALYLDDQGSTGLHVFMGWGYKAPKATTGSVLSPLPALELLRIRRPRPMFLS